jgi:DNA polymerase
VKQWTGIEITLQRAKNIVADFRRTNSGILRLWGQLEQGLKQSRGEELSVELPSGRTVHYFAIAELERHWCGRVERGRARKALYGGLLTENLVQATARDLFSEAILRLETAGLRVVLHVHDEVIVEVNSGDVAEAQLAIQESMRSTPLWAAGLPIQVDTQIADAYRK